MGEGVESFARSLVEILVLVIGVDELQNDEGDERLGLGVRKCACRDYKHREQRSARKDTDRHAGQKPPLTFSKCKG
jgi:hypothetical protein